MSILDNLKTVLKHDKKVISEPQNISSSGFYNQKLHISESVYENPTPSGISHNIMSKQTYALSYLLDMAYVAATADNAFYLPKPYKISHAGKAAKVFEEKFNSDIEFTKDYFKKNIKTSKKLDSYVKPRKELYELIKTIYPDFCHHMEDKVSPEDYEFYKKNKFNLKKCLHCNESYSDTVSSHDVLLSYQDNLAKVIDTLDFSKACKIEDTFVASEITTFLDKFAELSDEEKKSFIKHKIKLPNGSTRALDFTKKLLDERNNRIEQYSSIEDLYKKLDEKKYVKLKFQNPKMKKQQSTDDNIR